MIVPLDYDPRKLLFPFQKKKSVSKILPSTDLYFEIHRVEPLKTLGFSSSDRGHPGEHAEAGLKCVEQKKTRMMHGMLSPYH